CASEWRKLPFEGGGILRGNDASRESVTFRAGEHLTFRRLAGKEGGPGTESSPSKRAVPARRSEVVGGERDRPLDVGNGRSAASVRAVRERLDEPVEHRARGAGGIFTLEAVSRAGEDDHFGADVLLLECLMDDLAVADVHEP